LITKQALANWKSVSKGVKEERAIANDCFRSRQRRRS
jgi:hypothetical protein